MMRYLRADLGRYGRTKQRLKAILISPGAWAVIAYRFSRWVYLIKGPAPLRWGLKVVSTGLQVWISIVTNIQIPATAIIGPGLKIAHTGYIVLAPDVVIGTNCTLT